MELINATGAGALPGRGRALPALRPDAVRGRRRSSRHGGGRRAAPCAARRWGAALVYPGRAASSTTSSSGRPTSSSASGSPSSSVSLGALWALLVAARAFPGRPRGRRHSPPAPEAGHERPHVRQTSTSSWPARASAARAAALAFARAGPARAAGRDAPGPGQHQPRRQPAARGHPPPGRAGACSTASTRRARSPCRRMQVFHHRRGFLMEAPFAQSRRGTPTSCSTTRRSSACSPRRRARTGRVTVRYLTRVAELLARTGAGRGVERRRPRGGHARSTRASSSARTARPRWCGGCWGSSCRRGRTAPATTASTSSGPPGYEDGMRLHLHPRRRPHDRAPTGPGMVGAAVLVRARGQASSSGPDRWRRGSRPSAGARRSCRDVRGAASPRPPLSAVARARRRVPARAARSSWATPST